MKRLIPVLLLALYGCAAYSAKTAAPKPVVILGNKTEAVKCECPDVAVQRARAEHWKAYAEKLETELGIPHESEDKP